MTTPLSPEAADVVAATVPLVRVLGTWVEAAGTESGQSLRFGVASGIVRYIEAQLRLAEEMERLAIEDAKQRHPSACDDCPPRGIVRPFRVIDGGAA